MSGLPADPLVRAAIAALDAFGAIQRLQVLILLPLWSRATELSEAQFDAVIAAYPPPPGEPDELPGLVDAGWGYSREPEPPPSGDPPGDEVLGLAVDGRGRAALDIPMPRRDAA